MIKSKLIGKPVMTETGTEPVSLSEVKDHLYIESGNADFDSLLTTLITQVRQWVEETTGLTLITKTITQIIDYESSFSIPYPPVTNFSSASIKNGVGTYDTQVEDDDFEIEAGRFISYVGNQRFKLVYEAGYTSTTLPQGLRLAILNEIARRFENRGDRVIVGSTNELLMPYKDLEWTI